jgi:hypothetical protein
MLGEGDNRMKIVVKRILFWTPRLLCIAFAAFLTMFALDVFGQGYGFWGTLWAFIMHQIPVLVLLLILAIAWRWEWVGAVLFAAAGVFYLVMAWGEFDWIAYASITGPLFLIAILFLINWIKKETIRDR